jgi:phosphosulfolactate phosphohydrolase-like enzyme
VLSGLAMRSNAAVAVSRLRATSVVVMALSEVIASYLL